MSGPGFIPGAGRPPADGVIRSDRLDLVPLTPAVIDAILRRDAAATARLLGVETAVEWPGDRAILDMRLAQMLAEPALEPFLLRAIVHRERGEAIGHIGFHGAPDAPNLLEIGLRGLELGYTVFEPHRRAGYATEAVHALMSWAHTVHGISDFVLSIAPGNVPSLRIAHRLGFAYHSVHMDPVDGEEHVYAGRFPRA